MINDSTALWDIKRPQKHSHIPTVQTGLWYQHVNGLFIICTLVRFHMKDVKKKKNLMMWELIGPELWRPALGAPLTDVNRQTGSLKPQWVVGGLQTFNEARQVRDWIAITLTRHLRTPVQPPSLQLGVEVLGQGPNRHVKASGPCSPW